MKNSALTVKRRAGRRGSAIVEMAISLMGFLMMTFGVMEFGLAVYDYDSCTSAAQDAVRYAAVHGALSPSPATADTVQAYVKSDVVAMDKSLITVATTWTPDNNPGSTVKVVVGYTIKPLAGVAFRKNINVSSTATTVINH